MYQNLEAEVEIIIDRTSWSAGRYRSAAVIADKVEEVFSDLPDYIFELVS